MSYHNDRDRDSDRRGSSRGGHVRGYDDPPEDYRAKVELLDLPGFLIEDQALCKRFINHYFTRLTHFPIDEVELFQVANTNPEAGEIAGLRCFITLPERDAWARLVKACDKDPPVKVSPDQAQVGEESDETLQFKNLEWKHLFNPKYMPTWSLIQRYETRGKVIQGESIRQLLYNRKVTFRVHRIITTKCLARAPFILHDDTRRLSTRKNNISSVRSIDRRPSAADSSERDGERGRPVEPVVSRADIVGPKDAGRPVSWDVEDGQLDDIAAQQNNTRSSTRQNAASPPDLRPADEFVGFPEHDEITDPWFDRHLEGNFKENLQWLERYREYLLRPELGAVKLSTIIPLFVEDRTVVVWQLARTWTRIDDVKIRQVAEGWAPAGRIGYISFISINDQQEILRKCSGYNFPKQVVQLRATAYWKAADELDKGGGPYLSVGEARSGEWCPVASKLFNGKLDPAAAAGRERYVYKPQKRGIPTGSSRMQRPPPSARDTLDFTTNVSYYDEPPAEPSDHTPDASPGHSYGPLPPPARASGPIPAGANEEQMKKMLQQFGSIEKIEISSVGDRNAIVKFRAHAGLTTAQAAARKAHPQARFPATYELSVKLADFQPAEEAIWIEWDRKNQSDANSVVEGTRPASRSSRNPPKYASTTESGGSTQGVPPVASVGGGVPASERVAESLDDVSALLRDGPSPSSPRPSPPPPLETIAAARLPPPPPIASGSARASVLDDAPSPTIRSFDADSSANTHSAFATSINATALGTAPPLRPTVPAAPQPRAAGFFARIPGRGRMQNAATAMAALVASQVGLVASEPAKRPSDEEDAREAAAAKRRRFE
ncbi:hypothetical protein QFC22_004666 [Naganishia vaughanmartiniae]|uniref:Uncharacterized protein n=1 Tax=Naganishia vaughanmartiniae TaxID=1424756 RepID=A0ACC2WZ26_9TREE|nr:hypothetical protein QFC22_004666 [Naganishia vaughanmartiniae]